MTYRTHTEFATKLSPEGVVKALTDFSPDRPSVWPNLDPAKYEVHELGDTHAVVTEGNTQPNIWARERYDWSKPGQVTWTVEQSNFCARGSSVSVKVTPRADGGSHVALDWQRTPTTWSARFFLALVPVLKDRVLGIQRALDRIAEERESQGGHDQMRVAA